MVLPPSEAGVSQTTFRLGAALLPLLLIAVECTLAGAPGVVADGLEVVVGLGVEVEVGLGVVVSVGLGEVVAVGVLLGDVAVGVGVLSTVGTGEFPFPFPFPWPLPLSAYEAVAGRRVPRASSVVTTSLAVRLTRIL